MDNKNIILNLTLYRNQINYSNYFSVRKFKSDIGYLNYKIYHNIRVADAQHINKFISHQHLPHIHYLSVHFVIAIIYIYIYMY